MCQRLLYLTDLKFSLTLWEVLSCLSLGSLSVQEGSRRGQKVPQGVRSGAQGPVVHRLPLEKSLPAVPRLKTRARTRCGQTDDRTETLSREDLNQSRENCSYVFVFFTLTCFLSFLMECKWSFVYLCTPRTHIRDGANCWLTLGVSQSPGSFLPVPSRTVLLCGLSRLTVYSQSVGEKSAA